MTLPDLFFASLPLAWFMLISSITPGPNNLMLAASGMNFGIRRTVPHMVGVATGFMTLMYLCAFGVGAVYHAYPEAHVALNIFCAAYILWLSWKIATAAGPEEKKAGSKPLTFLQAFMFQYINPKGWVMALASTSTLLPQVEIGQQALVILVNALVISAPCVCIWTAFGTAIAKIFRSEKSRRVINIALGLMLVATIPLMLLH